MDEESVAHPYNAMILSNKKESTVDTNCNLDESQRHDHAEWKKSFSKDSMYVTFLKIQNHCDEYRFLVTRG